MEQLRQVWDGDLGIITRSRGYCPFLEAEKGTKIPQKMDLKGLHILDICNVLSKQN